MGLPFQQEERMKLHARIWVLALLTGVLFAGIVTAAQASFGVEKFVAANCGKGHEECFNGAKEPEGTQKKQEEEAKEAGAFQQAGGFVPYGVTDFKLKTVNLGGGILLPEGAGGLGVKSVRTDVAPGVVTNPEAVPKCSMSTFEAKKIVPAKGLEPAVYLESECPTDTIVGVNRATTFFKNKKGELKNIEVEGLVYNLEPPAGLASDYGVAIDIEKLAETGFPVFSHSFIEGSVEWLSDYHDYFKINNIAPGLIESRLVFFGGKAKPKVNGKEPEVNNVGFLRNPSACTSPGPATTTDLNVESYASEKAPQKESKSPLGSINCEGESEPFKPIFNLATETNASDAPDGITVTATMNHPEPVEEGTDSSDLKTAEVTLPEGMTMNPSAAAGLQACTPGQIGLNPASPAVSCPPGSRIGTVKLEVPTLPPGSLSGGIYLGREEGQAITGPPYKIYLDAESPENRYNVKVRLEGIVEPNPTTGRLTTKFVNNPAAPFNSAVLHFNGGAFAPIANPQPCGSSGSQVSFTSYATGLGPNTETVYSTEGCATTFQPTQSSGTQPMQAGGSNTFTLTMERPEGQQYLNSLRTVLPKGLVGNIPAATQCTEAQLSTETCPASSQVGDSTATAGSGPEPFPFHGKVYLAGPGEGAPYRLAVFTPIVAGPFNLGVEKTIVKLNIDQNTAQVIATANLPTIKAGIPVRLRALTMTMNRQGFMRNPTNCSGLETESTFTSTLGTVSPVVKSALAVEGCSGLAFKPSFKAVTSGKTSRLNGASLETTITQAAGQANIKSVEVMLPKQLVSRQHTNEKACLPAVFASNPSSCPKESLVGSATAVTPTLPNPMTGAAYLVARGGAEFPDLDLVLEGNNGIRIILKGHTFIHNSRTITDFESTPDVPVSSITVKLPAQPFSALAPNGNLCTTPLIMPTVITGQNGVVVKQNTVLTVKDCGVQITGHKVVGKTAFLTVQTFSAGRITGSGAGVATVSRSFGSAQRAVSLKLRKRHGHGKVTLKVSFKPKAKGLPSSTASVTVKY
jgi:hypothetical protein